MSFMFDVETLGVDSDSIILSAAIVHFTGHETMQELIDTGLMVKFDFAEQKAMGRTKDADTVAWWNNQGEFQKKASLYPSKRDVSAEDGIKMLRNYVKDNDPEGKQYIWARGNLDQIVIESLARQLGVDSIAGYQMYRDVRTFITLMKDTEKNGYCEVPEGMIPEGALVKHEPLHDCVLDIMMMVHGK